MVKVPVAFRNTRTISVEYLQAWENGHVEEARLNFAQPAFEDREVTSRGDGPDALAVLFSFELSADFAVGVEKKLCPSFNSLTAHRIAS
jgi:hypothetical protein